MKHLYILTLLSGLLLTNTLNAAVRYVKTNGTAAAAASAATTWTAACADLQAVINASASGDEIWVAAGKYVPNRRADNVTGSITEFDRDNAFVLKAGVRLYGGFNGTEAALADRNPKLHITLLSGDLDGNDTEDPDGISTDNRENNAFHVVIGTAIPATTVLDGVTLTGGNADGSVSITVNGRNVNQNDGGGMYNDYSSPTLTNVTLAGNTATEIGGGMYNTLSSPTLKNTLLWANVNPGVYNVTGSAPVYSYCLIQGANLTGTGTGTGNLDGKQPWPGVFVDPAAGDYRLNGGSPAIDRGNNADNTEPLDLAGRPRIFGSAIDLGAYESARYFAKEGAAGSGSSWADASGDLQALINAPCEEIWVAAGKYVPRYTADGYNTATNTFPSTSGGRNNAFVLRAGVRLYGGFPANANDIDHKTLAGRNLKTNKTILSGDLDGNDTEDPDGISTVIVGNNAYHVIIATNIPADGQTLLDGFTVTGGDATGPGGLNIINGWTTVYQSEGGGIYNLHSNPALTGVTVAGNTASNYGGGIYNHHSDPALTGVTVAGNSASNYGGGMYNASSSPTLTSVSIAGNRANGGGGMYSENNSSPKLTNVTVAGNTATGQGGGMYNNQSSPTLENTLLWGNSGQTPGVYSVNGSAPVCFYSLIQGEKPSGNGNLDGTQPWTDVIDDNYRLTPCSPAVNAGDNSLTAETRDLDGNSRKYGQIDLGAFEYQGATVGLSINNSQDITFGESKTLTLTGASDWTVNYSVDGVNRTPVTATASPCPFTPAAAGTCVILSVTSSGDGCTRLLSGISFTVNKATLPAPSSVAIKFENETLTGFYKHPDSIYLLSFNGEPAIEISDTAYFPLPDEWMTGQTLTVIKKGDGVTTANSPNEWMTGETFGIVKKGDGVTTVNSPAQPLDIPARPALSGLSVTHATTVGGDGSIDGTDDVTMQYSVDSISWIPCDAGSTALAPNTYYIHIKDTGAAFRSKAVTLTILPTEATPSVAINFATETLTGFDPGSTYYVISADDDTTTVTAAATLNIPDEWMTGETFGIVKKGDGTTTVNSPAQSLAIPARPVLSGLDVTHATTVGGNGSITGTDATTMQYSTDSISWEACAAGSTALAPDTYHVRIKDTPAAFRSRAVTLTILPTEATPTVAIDFEYEMLTGFDPGSVYYIISAADDTTTVTGGTPLSIPDEWMTGETFSIVKKGNGTTSVNSPAQPLVIPARPVLSGLDVTHAVTVGGNGSITGTTTDMQHSTDSTIWTDCNAGSTVLAPDTYYVRLKDTPAAFRSKAVTLTILPTEATPSVAIDFEYETLTGFDPGSIYYVISAGLDTTTVSGIATLNIPDEWMTGETFGIVKKGDGTTTVNSPAQSLAISARPATPSGLGVTNAVTAGGNGSINGTTTAMQYSTDSTLWTDCTAGSTVLAPGTYYVRLKDTPAAFRSRAVTLTILTTEATPSIDIDFATEKLTGFDPGSTYYVISAGLDTTTVSGVAALDIPDEWMTGKTFRIVKKGNGTTTVNSPAQPLDIPARLAAPSTPGTEEETAFGADDGRITGLPAGTEYSADGGQTWHGVSGTQIAGLAPGQYLIRQKATPGSFPGQPVTVTLRAMPRIDFSPELYMYSGSSYTLPAVVTDPAGLTVHYNLRPEDAWMASVSDGVLHVLYPGVVELTACTEATATCQAACLTVRITASDPPVPAIMREVVLPQVAGVTTDPPAGTYHVESHHDFIFTLTLAVPSATAPAVRTIYIPDGSDSGSETEVTPAAAPDSYTVRVRSVTRSPLQIVIEIPDDTGTDTPPSDAARVWTAAGHLHIVSPVAGEARVYSATGVLIKIIRYEAGETVRVPLPKGFHAVVLSGGKTVKIINYGL